MLGFTGFHSVFTGFYWVLRSFVSFYWILLGFTGFYWVLLGIDPEVSEVDLAGFYAAGDDAGGPRQLFQTLFQGVDFCGRRLIVELQRGVDGAPPFVQVDGLWQNPRKPITNPVKPSKTQSNPVKPQKKTL